MFFGICLPVSTGRVCKAEMSGGTVEFTAEFAGVAVRICCRHEENRAFLSDYLSNRDPVFAIEPSEKDLEAIRVRLLQQAEKDGITQPRLSEAFLESNVIHFLLAEGLVHHNVLLMHGSALCMDGEAYLFTAASGTGKSTHARLWRELFGDRVWMINDDKPLLRVGTDGITEVFGSPWDGKHHLSRNASAPLKAIVSLQRGTENSIEALSSAQAFAVLRRRAYISSDRDTAEAILALENRLITAIPFYRLVCNMECEAARVAWKGMNPELDYPL